MHKIALIALLSLPLFAGFFPQTVHTSIKSVSGKTVILQSKLPVTGMKENSQGLVAAFANPGAVTIAGGFCQ